MHKNVSLSNEVKLSTMPSTSLEKHTFQDKHGKDEKYRRKPGPKFTQDGFASPPPAGKLERLTSERQTHTLPFTLWCGSVWWVYASFQRDHNFCTLSLLKHFRLQCTCTALQPLSLLSTLNAKHNTGYSRAAVRGGYNSYPGKDVALSGLEWWKPGAWIRAETQQREFFFFFHLGCSVEMLSGAKAVKYSPEASFCTLIYPAHLNL